MDDNIKIKNVEIFENMEECKKEFKKEKNSTYETDVLKDIFGMGITMGMPNMYSKENEEQIKKESEELDKANYELKKKLGLI